MFFKYLYTSCFMLHFAASPQCDTGELAVAIHGLSHNAFHMYSMGKFLGTKGYETYCYDYKTTRGNVIQHANDFKTHLEELVRKYPERRINIITHSLGSLVTRQVLGSLTTEGVLTKDKIKCVVMLAPPNRGSKVAEWALKYIPFSNHIMKSLPDLAFGEDSPVHDIPIPQGIPLGIIAASHDILVPRISTPLETQDDYIVMNSGHSFIMMRPKVQKQVLYFLQHRRFNHDL